MRRLPQPHTSPGYAPHTAVSTRRDLGRSLGPAPQWKPSNAEEEAKFEELKSMQPVLKDLLEELIAAKNILTSKVKEANRSGTVSDRAKVLETRLALAENAKVREAEWSIPDVSSLLDQYPKGQGVMSPAFCAAGIPNMQLIFYPNGTSEAQAGYCSVALKVPPGTRLSRVLYVNHETFGPESTKQPVEGVTNACLLQKPSLAVRGTAADTVVIGVRDIYPLRNWATGESTRNDATSPPNASSRKQGSSDVSGLERVLLLGDAPAAEVNFQLLREMRDREKERERAKKAEKRRLEEAARQQEEEARAEQERLERVAAETAKVVENLAKPVSVEDAMVQSAVKMVNEQAQKAAKPPEETPEQRADREKKEHALIWLKEYQAKEAARRAEEEQQRKDREQAEREVREAIERRRKLEEQQQKQDESRQRRRLLEEEKRKQLEADEKRRLLEQEQVAKLMRTAKEAEAADCQELDVKNREEQLAEALAEAEAEAKAEPAEAEPAEAEPAEAEPGEAEAEAEAQTAAAAQAEEEARQAQLEIEQRTRELQEQAKIRQEQEEAERRAEEESRLLEERQRREEEERQCLAEERRRQWKEDERKRNEEERQKREEREAEEQRRQKKQEELRRLQEQRVAFQKAEEERLAKQRTEAEAAARQQKEAEERHQREREQLERDRRQQENDPRRLAKKAQTRSKRERAWDKDENHDDDDDDSEPGEQAASPRSTPPTLIAGTGRAAATILRRERNAAAQGALSNASSTKVLPEDQSMRSIPKPSVAADSESEEGEEEEIFDMAKFRLQASNLNPSSGSNLRAWSIAAAAKPSGGESDEGSEDDDFEWLQQRRAQKGGFVAPSVLPSTLNKSSTQTSIKSAPKLSGRGAAARGPSPEESDSGSDAEPIFMR